MRRYVPLTQAQTNGQTNTLANAGTDSGTAQSPIVLDEVADAPNLICDTTLAGMGMLAMKKAQRMTPGTISEAMLRGRRCEGILVRFPPKKNHHTSYPFGIHNERDVPWDYHSINDRFYIQAKLCRGPFVNEVSACQECRALTSTPLYAGIMDHIQNGMHESTPLVYHGVGGLIEVARQKSERVRQVQLTKLNTSRKLLRKATTLDSHKQWVMAIASRQVDRVASLVQAGLKHRAGIKTLIQEYERTVEKLYRPKGYTNEDIMQSIVMLRLGGTCVAEFAHRSLSLPSPTTIQRNTVMRSLIVSPSAPTVTEIEENTKACYPGVTTGEELSSGGLSIVHHLVHQVLMLDELAVEWWIRWDNSKNKFLGTCREHNHQISLDFTSEKELEILCDTLNNNDIHFANEATVAGIGVLSANPCEYAVHPIMFLGTFKRETGPHHACMIQTILDAAAKVKI
jgi:hypothetical protein